jgi:hypothetical protein
MAKSIAAMAIGIAIGEGVIKSVDDTAETYVPGFKDAEYGKMPIRDLLHMSSGVEFGETKDGQRDLNRLWIGYRDLAKGGDSLRQLLVNRKWAGLVQPPEVRPAFALPPAAAPEVRVCLEDGGERIGRKSWRASGARRFQGPLRFGRRAHKRYRSCRTGSDCNAGAEPAGDFADPDRATGSLADEGRNPRSAHSTLYRAVPAPGPGSRARQTADFETGQLVRRI